MRAGPRQGLDPGGGIGPLGVQGDELAGQVGQHHCGGVGAGDGDTLAFQGRDDLGGPGGVASAPVFLEPGVDPCLARPFSGRLGWARRRRASGTASCARPGPHHGLEG